MSSFGFVWLPASSSSQSTEKRAKTSHHSEKPSPQSADSPLQLQPPKSPQVPQSTSTTFSRNDLGTYSVDKVKGLSDKVKGLSDEERLWLIRNPCRPDTSYKYPQKEEYGKKRSFQQTWLKQLALLLGVLFLHQLCFVWCTFTMGWRWTSKKWLPYLQKETHAEWYC